MSFVDSRIITISSEDAISRNSLLSDCLFSFNNIFSNEEDIIQKYITIKDAEIPISWYVVNEYNNTLKYSLSNNPNIVYTEYIPYGNYNAQTITTVPVFTNVLKLTLDKITGKFIITNNDYNFTIYASSRSILRVLGLNENINHTSNNKMLIGNYPCDFSGINRIKINSDTIKTYNYDTRTQGFSNTFHTISVNSGSFGILLYQNINNFKCILRNEYLNEFDIKIYGDDNNLIDFNGIHWTLTLQIDLIRKVKEIIPSNPYTSNIQEEEKQEEVQEDVQDADLDLLLYNNHIYR